MSPNGPLSDFESVYYDPSHSASYSTPSKLWRATGQSVPIDDVHSWLEGEDAYTLHKPIRRRFPRCRVYANNIDQHWQADLTSLQNIRKENDGFSFILCIIDVFSKFAWCEPLQNKTGKAVVQGFERIFSRTDRRPEYLCTDKGKEFLAECVQAFLKRHGIHYFHTNNPDTKASVAERFQRTIKEKLWKLFTYTNSYRYVDVLQSVVTAYNSTYHRSIKMRPDEVTENNVLTVYRTLYPRHVLTPSHVKAPKLRVGDVVRIGREKGVFEKGYAMNWTEEVFRVERVIPRIPVVYILQDLAGERIEGSFYEAELQKVREPTTFKIAYIVKSKGKGSSRQKLVHWRSYPEKFRSWVADSDLQILTQ